jgi:SAM-dependent methyltransferase
LHSFEDRWRARFEEFAELRDDDAGIAGWSTTGLDARLRRFAGLWRPAAQPELWLDAGCGAGSYTRMLLRHGRDVVGVDYSWPTLQKTRARELQGARFVVADVRKLPFTPGQFDGALCFGVTQALLSSESAVSELTAQVRPGGELWMDALNRHCLVHALELLRRRLTGRALHLRYESPMRLRRLLQQHGLTDVRIVWMPIMPSGSLRLQRLAETKLVQALLHAFYPLGMLLSHAFIVHGRIAARDAVEATPGLRFEHLRQS